MPNNPKRDPKIFERFQEPLP